MKDDEKSRVIIDTWDRLTDAERDLPLEGQVVRSAARFQFLVFPPPEPGQFVEFHATVFSNTATPPSRYVEIIGEFRGLSLPVSRRKL